MYLTPLTALPFASHIMNVDSVTNELTSFNIGLIYICVRIF